MKCSTIEVRIQVAMAEELLTHLAARYPLQTMSMTIGGRDWHIRAVQDQDFLLDVADTLENVPYGFLLWEAAIGLAQWLAEQPALVAGKRVLELGAGVGLAGLMAAALGAQVWQTDHQPDALALAHVNAHAHGYARGNGCSGIEQFLADWRTWQHTERYDVILGADILYERAMYAHLEPIFQQNLAPGGCLLLADPCRPQALEFVAHLEKRGWHFELSTRPVILPTAPDAPSQANKKANQAVEVALLIGRREN